MGAVRISFEGSDFAAAMQRLPDVFYQRSGLVLEVEVHERTPDGSASSWWLSIPELHQNGFADLYVNSSSELAHQRIGGRWYMPVHPYVWHQVQASLKELGFRSISVSGNCPAPEQTVPRRWNRRWSELSLLRRFIYGSPPFWLRLFS